MVVHPLRAAWVFSVLFAGIRFAPGAVSSAEDLTGCKLPNGRATLPLTGTPQASNGTLFKLSTNAFSTPPAAPDGKTLSSDDVLAKIRDSKAADIQFLPDNKGSLWLFSGCIADAPPGVVFLADVSGKKLDAPGLVPKTTRNLAGQYNDVQESAVYLCKTTDNYYALIRVLEKTTTALTIQYVYQPDGTLNFDIPINPVIAYQPLLAGASATTAPATPEVSRAGASGGGLPSAATQPAMPPRIATTLPAVPKLQLGPGDINEPGRIVLVSPSPVARGGATVTPSAGVSGSQPAPAAGTALDSLLRQRAQLLQADMALIEAPARTDAEKDRKTQAINELASLHADEPAVADLLVANITFVATSSSVREISPEAFLPCFGALKRMGSTGTNAALKGLRSLALDAPGTGTDAPTYKADLLGRVIRAVEGDDVAEFIFHRESAKTTDPKPRAVFEYVLEKR